MSDQTKPELTKLDLKKTHKRLYTASAGKVDILDVPPLSYLMIDGSGDPNTAPMYQEAVSALYSTAYALKFAVKKEQGIDYAVMPLEGLWWVDDLSQFSYTDRSNWRWTMLVVQPEMVTSDLFTGVVAEVARKKKLPLLDHVRLETFAEGLSAQILHVGPYSAEAPTIARLHDSIKEQGYVLRGKHHEIYLGDPNRTAPEKLKTIIRQPAKKA